jgi:hypothetical protein
MLSVYGQRQHGFIFLFGCRFISICKYQHGLVYDHSFQFNSFRWTVLFTYFDYFQYLSPHRYVELQIADCIKLTAKYLKLRGDLWTVTADRKAIIEKQLHLQVELTIHQSIREYWLADKVLRIFNQNRKMLLVFISLVEILELALSTAFDHNTLHQNSMTIRKCCALSKLSLFTCN